MMKKIISAMLAVIMVITLIPVQNAEAAIITEPEIKDIVDLELMEFIESLPNSNPQIVAKEMIEHAVFGNGEDLILDKQDALFSTLFNTRVIQDALSEGITNTITFMEDMD